MSIWPDRVSASQVLKRTADNSHYSLQVPGAVIIILVITLFCHLCFSRCPQLRRTKELPNLAAIRVSHLFKD